MSRCFSLLFAGFVPLAAVAQTTCPDGSSLATTGILFTDDLGVTKVHRLTAPNTVTVTIDDDGYRSRNTLVHGVHVLQLADEENGEIVPTSLWDFTFPVATAKLPRPTPNGSWEAATTYTYAGDREAEQVRHSWGSLTSHRIGGCTYDAIPVVIEYSSEYYDHVEELLYFPELGTAILTVYSDADVRDIYTHVEIGLP